MCPPPLPFLPYLRSCGVDIKFVAPEGLINCVDRYISYKDRNSDKLRVSCARNWYSFNSRADRILIKISNCRLNDLSTVTDRLTDRLIGLKMR